MADQDASGLGRDGAHRQVAGPVLDWAAIERGFHDALARPRDERKTFVRNRIVDAAIAREVCALLDAHESSHALLDAPAVSALPTGMRIGPYALDRLLGTGGMATVYLAHRADQQFDRHVAIKLVNQGLAAEIVGDRFQVERQALARLDHPNIARLIDAGLTGFGQPFIVMEWVDGVPLDKWIAAAHPSLEQALSLWLQLADAVSDAHRNLVVHRDLKPSNVLVARDGRPKLVDFGVAKLLEDGPIGALATATSHFTPLYASPEQLKGEAVTTSTDVYGLGLLLYALAAGGWPYGDTRLLPHQCADVILRGEVHMPPRVPGDLAAIIRMALRPVPDRRYASVDQFADDVRRFMRGRPVVAQPESLAYHARTLLKRHRVAATLAALVTLSLVALTLVAWRQARRADQQRARAEQVTSFITGFLGATPSGPDWALRNKGVSLRVVELADVMAGRIESELATQPDAEETLRAVLAMTYFEMGEIQKSERNARRALALCDQLYSDDDPRRVSPELLLAAVENSLGQFDAAERRAERVMSTWPNASPVDQAAVALQLGLARLRLGRTVEAERTIRESIARVETSLGPDHPSVGLSTSYLGLVHLERGEFDQAVVQLERSAAISRRTFKEASMPLAWALVNLANAYRFLGRPDDVRRVSEASYTQFEGSLGESHYSMVHPLAFIAYAQALQGDAGAEATARRAIAVQDSLPPDHYERAVGLTFLGFVLMQEHKLADARAALSRALDLRRAAFKPPNWRIAETAGWLGEVLALQGDVRAARPLLEESLQTFETLYGPANPRTVDARARLQRSVAGERLVSAAKSAGGGPSAR